MVTSVSSMQNTTGAVTTQSSTDLGRDAFLRLLTTELSNQDPISPMDDKDFISQLAQFSSLEQSETLNQNMSTFIQSQSITSAAALVGKNVTALDSNSGQMISGMVESIRLNSGEVTLKIGDNDIPIGNVTSIS